MTRCTPAGHGPDRDRNERWPRRLLTGCELGLVLSAAGGLLIVHLVDQQSMIAAVLAAALLALLSALRRSPAVGEARVGRARRQPGRRAGRRMADRQ